MPWIDTVPCEQSTGRLRQLYDRVKGPGNNIDNIMMMHSLRPHSMEGHMALDKHVLHHGANTVAKSFLETIGLWVSLPNRCAYCAEHHCAGLGRLLGDDARSAAIRAALESGAIEAGPFEPREKLALRYAEVLTRDPSLATEAMVAGMRAAGYDDGESLEINQVTAYFAYANRTVLGLGCSTEGDILGLSPDRADDPGNWSHSRARRRRSRLAPWCAELARLHHLLPPIRLAHFLGTWPCQLRGGGATSASAASSRGIASINPIASARSAAGLVVSAVIQTSPSGSTPTFRSRNIGPNHQPSLCDGSTFLGERPG